MQNPTTRRKPRAAALNATPEQRDLADLLLLDAGWQVTGSLADHLVTEAA